MGITDIKPISFNFTNIHTELFEWILRGYERSMGAFFIPIVIAGIVTYVYLKNQSAVAAAVAILIIFSSFVSSAVLLQAPAFVLLMQGIVILAFSGLITYFYIKRRG